MSGLPTVTGFHQGFLVAIVTLGLATAAACAIPVTRRRSADTLAAQADVDLQVA